MMKKIIKAILLGIGSLFAMVVVLVVLFIAWFFLDSAFDKDKNLIKATMNQDIDKVVTLIEKGADVNAQDRWHDTPLIIASARSEEHTSELQSQR